MTQQLAITVTEDHIARGIRRDRESCPIALALGEKLKTFVSVDQDHIEIGDNEAGIDSGDYRTNDTIAEFVADFDWDLEVVPITFLLTLIPRGGFGYDEGPPGEEALL